MARHVLTPAYGRDYGSRAAVETDLKAGKDFVLCSPYGTTYANLDQFEPGDTLNVRYDRLRKVAVFTVPAKGPTPGTTLAEGLEHGSCDDFMEACDRLCLERYGISVHDCADIAWWDIWQSGATPEEALEELAEQDEVMSGLRDLCDG